LCILSTKLVNKSQIGSQQVPIAIGIRRLAFSSQLIFRGVMPDFILFNIFSRL
jgi:hypothetical protein